MESMHYHRPASVADAVKLAGQHGDDKILAGGQSMLPSMRLGLLSPDRLDRSRRRRRNCRASASTATRS